MDLIKEELEQIRYQIDLLEAIFDEQETKKECCSLKKSFNYYIKMLNINKKFIKNVIKNINTQKYKNIINTVNAAIFRTIVKNNDTEFGQPS